MRELPLPSGAILKVAPADFATSKRLFQAVLAEMRTVKVDAKEQIHNLLKDLFCVGFSSPAIEACLDDCLKKCLYNSGKGDFKINADTFEPVEARQDYLTVLTEVAKENINPFAKSLYAAFKEGTSIIDSFQV